MQRLAILEEEKKAADKRIEEEYQKRMDNEDKYYLEKREVLMDSIMDIQSGVYGTSSSGKNEDGGEGDDEEKKEDMGSEKVKVEGSATKFTAWSL